MPLSALTSQNLAIGYYRQRNSKTVAEGIKINLHRGKLTCLMGANGIGKSTLIKTLSGVLHPISGGVYLGATNINSIGQLEIAQSISVVLTEKPSSGFMTVRDLINLGRFPYTNWQNNFNERDSQVVEAAINNIGLAELSDHPISELSDGNLQKAIIGRALAQDTDIIILDEPTIHLDVNNKTIIIKLLKKLCHENGKTILLSTHDLDLTMRFADRLWLFSEGKISEGLPEDLSLNGSLNQVFPEAKSSSGQTKSAGENLDIEGDPKIVKLVRQAIDKSSPSENTKQLPRIKVSQFKSELLITFGSRTFSSIEEFLIALLNEED